MPTQMPDFTRLALLAQRLMDAELLPIAESGALAAESEAACRSLQAGDPGAARRCVERVVQLTEGLIHVEALDPADGRALLEAARHILDGHGE
jgi:hypothetical protein